MLPERFGRYEVLAELGDGAVGRVYSAWDPKVSRVVAVNVSSEEDGTFVADVEVQRRSGSGASKDFRTLLVDVEPDDAVWGDDRLD